MATQTANYRLTKPELKDSPPDITVLNRNWDTIDTELSINFDFTNSVYKGYRDGDETVRNEFNEKCNTLDKRIIQAHNSIGSIASQLANNFSGKLKNLGEKHDTDKIALEKKIDGVNERVSLVNADVLKLLNVIFADGAGAHNNLYRGNNLGNTVTPEQWNAIYEGKFTDLYIGDYWTINGIKWQIAAFDYYYNTGKTACTTHHVTIVPSEIVGQSNMSEAESTDGGYPNTIVFKQQLPHLLTNINQYFGGEEHILGHNQLFPNAVDGYPTDEVWYPDTKIFLMSERNVYGNPVLSRMNDGGANRMGLETLDKTQYPLFRLRPDLIGIRQGYWLRDVCNTIRFCHVSPNGQANFVTPTRLLGIRPAFSICSKELLPISEEM